MTKMVTRKVPECYVYTYIVCLVYFHKSFHNFHGVVSTFLVNKDMFYALIEISPANLVPCETSFLVVAL
jgi:hypothetical protein